MQQAPILIENTIAQYVRYFRKLTFKKPNLTEEKWAREVKVHLALQSQNYIFEKTHVYQYWSLDIRKDSNVTKMLNISVKSE